MVIINLSCSIIHLKGKTGWKPDKGSFSMSKLLGNVVHCFKVVGICALGDAIGRHLLVLLLQSALCLSAGVGNLLC